VRLKVNFVKIHPAAQTPKKNNSEDAGWDFAVVSDNDFFVPTQFSSLYKNYQDKIVCVLPPKEQKIFHTGIKVEIPNGWCLVLFDRSGLGAKKIVHRTAGVIDSSYRGEVLVSLVNLSSNDVIFCEGDKIIQGLLLPVPSAEFIEVNELSNTQRGEKGFGSSDEKERS
jgi:dUTP pyrophosphatase